MARTRAERRHNTAKKCKARKALTTVFDGEFGPLCSGNVTPSGERCSWGRCVTDKNNIHNQRDHFIQLKKKEDAFWKAQY